MLLELVVPRRGSGARLELGTSVSRTVECFFEPCAMFREWFSPLLVRPSFIISSCVGDSSMNQAVLGLNHASQTMFPILTGTLLHCSIVAFELCATVRGFLTPQVARHGWAITSCVGDCSDN